MDIPPVRLLDKVRQCIRLKGYSIRTEKSYVSWIKRYILFHEKRHPQDMGKPEIEAFLSHLVMKRNVASSTQNQAFNAILFLYNNVIDTDMPQDINSLRSKKPIRLPTVMTREETLNLIRSMHGTHQLMAKLMYGSGLRVMECIRLRIKDVDHAMNQIIVRDGYDIRTVQELLGHKDVSTTMIYTHVLNRGGRGVKSPLDIRV